MSDAPFWTRQTNPHHPAVLFPTLGLLQLVAAFSLEPHRPFTVMARLAVGIFTWTFIEYVFHRWMLHVPLGNPPWDFMSKYMHWQHHEEPREPGNVAAALWATVPIYALLFGTAWAIFGMLPALGWSAGLAFGYALYERVHYVVHFKPCPGPVLHWLKRHHALHHFQDHHKRFGVSSPLWDLVFGTFR